MAGGVAFFNAIQWHPSGNAKTVVAVDGYVGETALHNVRRIVDTRNTKFCAEIPTKIDATNSLILPLISEHTIQQKVGTKSVIVSRRHVLHASVTSTWIGTRAGSNALPENCFADNKSLHSAVVAPNLRLFIAGPVDFYVVIVAFENRAADCGEIGQWASQVW